MPVDHRTTQPFGLLHGGICRVGSKPLARGRISLSA